MSAAGARVAGTSAWRQRLARYAFPAYATIVLAIALILWVIQTGSLSTPCVVVPECPWPRLGAAGFETLADLGFGPQAWAVTASLVSLIWSLVPFGLGVLIALSTTDPRLRYLSFLWVTLSLGVFSAVPTDAAVQTVLRTIVIGAWFAVFATFPTGMFRPRWVSVAVVIAVCWTVVLSLPPIRASSDPLWWALEAGGYVIACAVIVGALLVQFARGDADVRRQLALLLVAFVPFLALAVASTALNATLDPTLLGYGSLAGALLAEVSSLLITVLFACIALAVVRHGAYGARFVLNRVLLGALAIAIAMAVYGATVALVSALVAGWIPQAIAAVTTAVVLALAFRAVERVVDRLVYGDADDPESLIAALGEGFAAAASPAELLDDIASTVAERLRLPWLRLRFADAEVPDVLVGTVQDRGSDTVPLVIGAHRLGTAEVGLRAGQRRLGRRDRRAFAAATGTIAAAVAAYRVNIELQASRRSVLGSRDTERRSLRRKLHDEIGPTLAVAGHRIAAARHDLVRAPAAVDGHLAGASAAVGDAVEQMREISRALRPPALDELGLVGAITSFSEGMPLRVTVDASLSVPLADAMEVAAYRILVEALINAERHAHADDVRVSLVGTAESLSMEVSDDGRGFPRSFTPGVGVTSIRERIDELGGTLELGSSRLGGARVSCRLPFDRDPVP